MKGNIKPITEGIMKGNIKNNTNEPKPKITPISHPNKKLIIEVNDREDRKKKKSFSNNNYNESSVSLNVLQNTVSKAIAKHLEVTIEFCDNLQPYLKEHPSDFLNSWMEYLVSIKYLKKLCDRMLNK
ncbi:MULTISPECIES: hypothetical protein [Leptospira]|uniref:Uncharacterized protein n=1 Tax=Leptospira interrogans str. UI 12758 TaxID=1049938 RepID=A0A0E2DB74_LEPIR|nr:MULTISPECIES: hypothetical protein [Leptospira]EKR57159.1 hypothetical protein LEP1GSC105_0116 [Leptospira interrogans str. UI 12758]EKR82528.1 hypothetical protein LEP1GSC099_1481 [Leptospira interrogans str. UI 08452]EMJ55954.1 hypothetical protein LEP1GSC111_4204 [Leptospira interrogans str. UT126]EMN33179.1 hypothetical protein LEP1GSC084_1108 [Leptospira interrogans serovar Medanensis str. L0448]UML78972.1 hypothetical protein FH602_02105 [Leptospira kirschneri]